TGAHRSSRRARGHASAGASWAAHGDACARVVHRRVLLPLCPERSPAPGSLSPEIVLSYVPPIRPLCQAAKVAKMSQTCRRARTFLHASALDIRARLRDERSTVRARRRSMLGGGWTGLTALGALTGLWGV